MIVNRSQPPKTWSDPRRYKPHLRRDFGYTCAYCWVHESYLGGEPAFEVEHLRPEGRPEFESLRATYSNLYYVWGPCNRAKGMSWPTDAEAAAGFGFVDPCAESAFEHFGYELDQTGHVTGRLLGFTPKGRYTIVKCDLNNPVLRDKRLELRWRFLRARRRLQTLTALLEDETLSDARRVEVESERVAAGEEITEILWPKPCPADPSEAGNSSLRGG